MSRGTYYVVGHVYKEKGQFPRGSFIPGGSYIMYLRIGGELNLKIWVSHRSPTLSCLGCP